MDIDFLCSEFDAWQIDPGDLGEYMEGNDTSFENLDINYVLRDMYEMAVRNAGWSDGIDGERVTAYFNCLDSHLYVDNEEVYDFAELKEAIDKIKPTTMTNNPNCDGSGPHALCGEQVRVLPTGGSSNAILCRSCLIREINYRLQRNKQLSDDTKFDLPKRDDLKVYNND